MAPHRSDKDANRQSVSIEEVRIISDLRLMHGKVDELYQLVINLKRRHQGSIIHKYADQAVLSDDIERVDEIYLWFLKLKEARDRERRKTG